MTDFEQLIFVVGTERILKLLQEVAKEAIDAGDWLKVRQITDIVPQITGHSVSVMQPHESDAGSSTASLASLSISKRCLELLNKAGIYTLSDLERYTLEDLLEINGIGEFAAKQIDSALQAQGVTLDSIKLRQRWLHENTALAEDLFSSESGELDADSSLAQSNSSYSESGEPDADYPMDEPDLSYSESGEPDADSPLDEPIDN
ncbi:MAG: hypothetical protein KME08_02845 [Aphanothece sp. CMT-3BRIN-NPC111]|jgi:NAD-dependent DNA ligase|nr:hypothetical protein [Aphanothece sp. CMT-3BRIN-NPC111]